MTEEKPQAKLPLMLLQPMPGPSVPVEAPKWPFHRPTDYTLELGAKICDHIGNDKTLRQIATMDGMPSTATIMRWVGKSSEFREMYQFAQMARFDLWGDRMLTLARGEPGPLPEVDEDDDSDRGEPPEATEPGADATKPVDKASISGVKQTIQRSRLEIATMQWLMGKRMPKTYGEPVIGAVEGPQGPAETVQAPRAVIIGGTDWKKQQ